MTDARTLDDVLAEDPGPLLDPAGGPHDEGLIGIYDDDPQLMEGEDDEDDEDDEDGEEK